MDLSLDQLKEMMFDYNSDEFINIYMQTKEASEQMGCMINSKSTDFIEVILNNTLFYPEKSSSDEDYISE